MIVDYLRIEHNTVFTNIVQPIQAYWMTNFDFKNNIFYGTYAYGVSQKAIDEGRVYETDDSSSAIVSFRLIDSLIVDDVGLTDADRKIYLSNNLYFTPQRIKYYWKTDYVVQEPLWINERTQVMFDDEAYPELNILNNITDVDPVFDPTMETMDIDSLFMFVDGFIENAWDWDGGVIGHYAPIGNIFDILRPLPENLAYSNTFLLTAETDGLPLGDLKWFSKEVKNIAPDGIAYIWYGNTDEFADGNKREEPELNDGNPDVEVFLNETGDIADGDVQNAWEAAGIVWSEAQSGITNVVFTNGFFGGTSLDNGAIASDFHIQVSRDGATWKNIDIESSPEYVTNDNIDDQGGEVSNADFMFVGDFGKVLGIRVLGKVRIDGGAFWGSYVGSARKVMVVYSEFNPSSGTEEKTQNTSSNILYQNYPNPFSTETSISFSVLNSGRTKLDVYNIQGQLVKSLVNRGYTPGTYSILFNVGDLTSGIYFYTLQSDVNSEIIYKVKCGFLDLQSGKSLLLNTIINHSQV